MCDTKYRIEKETLERFKNYVYNTELQDREVCVTLIKYDDEKGKTLYIDESSISIGTTKKETGRGSCNWKENYQNVYLFHSHPVISRSYPSTEDIIKVIKHAKIMISIVATRWGLYIIKPTENSWKIAHHWNDDVYKKYFKRVDQELSYIYELENKLGYKNNLYPQISILEENKIKTILERIQRLAYIDIKFCSWRELNI